MKLSKESPIQSFIAQSIELPTRLTGLRELMVSLFEPPAVEFLDAMNFTVRPKSADRLLLSEAGSRRKIGFLNAEVDAKKILFNMFACSYRSLCKKNGFEPDDSRVPQFLLGRAGMKAREQMQNCVQSHPVLGADGYNKMAPLKLSTLKAIYLKDDSEKVRQIDEGRLFKDCVKHLGVLSDEHFKRSSLRFTSRIIKKTGIEISPVVPVYAERTRSILRGKQR